MPRLYLEGEGGGRGWAYTCSKATTTTRLRGCCTRGQSKQPRRICVTLQTKAAYVPDLLPEIIICLGKSFFPFSGGGEGLVQFIKVSTKLAGNQKFSNMKFNLYTRFLHFTLCTVVIYGIMYYV